MTDKETYVHFMRHKTKRTDKETFVHFMLHKITRRKKKHSFILCAIK